MCGAIYYIIVYDCNTRWNENYRDLLYIGQARNLKRRIGDHKSPSRRCGQLVNTMMHKHRYDVGILWEGDDALLDQMERMYIRELESLYPWGLNIEPGGAYSNRRQMMYQKTEDWKKKHSESMKEVWATKQWVCRSTPCYFIDQGGTKHEFKTILDCSRELGVSPTSVRKSLYSDKRRTHSPVYGPVRVLPTGQ